MKEGAGSGVGSFLCLLFFCFCLFLMHSQPKLARKQAQPKQALEKQARLSAGWVPAGDQLLLVQEPAAGALVLGGAKRKSK
jgi:hypothetical protein